MIPFYAVISRIFKLTRTCPKSKRDQVAKASQKIDPYPVNFVGQAFLHHDKNRYLVLSEKIRDRFVFLKMTTSATDWKLFKGKTVKDNW